ncbi:LexA family protein [Leucobacter sp. NPDC058333]|uniref:LexA family protein n=1 Tax=Leucobacter sp. NPDC058333 TaxID=3346450 RepID=UPI00365C5300
MQIADIRALTADAPAALVDVANVEVLCGFPSPAQDYQTSELDLNEHLMPNRVSTFLIRARGHSIVRAGIFDGDELIVDRSIQAKDGHVVVAVVDGEMTVKRLRLMSDGSVVLSAENPQHPNIEIAELSELRVWGVVTRSLHRVLRT